MWLFAVALAGAEELTEDFATDSGRWSGGAVSDGVLRVEDGTATLELGDATSLAGTLRVRVAAGTAATVSLGDAAWAARYAPGGGIELGGKRLPMPTGHYRWVPDLDPVIDPGTGTWDAGNALHPEVFYDDASATWFLYWTGELAPPGYGYRQIGLATSADGQTWTPYAGNPVLTVDYDRTTVDGIHVHMPTVVKDDAGTWHMFYACYQNNVGNRICHATSADGYGWTPRGVALDKGVPGAFDEGSLRSPDVLIGPDGTWHLLYNGTDPEQHYGPTGYATSPDGWTWTKHGAISADGSRLQGGGMFDGPYGVEQWWNCDDVFCHSTATWDDLTDWRDEPGVTLAKGFADWSDGYVQAPSPWLVDTTWHIWFNAYSYDGDAHERIGHAETVPVPGAWLELAIAWDGETLAVTQSGATQTSAARGVTALVVGAEGVVEVDDVALTWAVAVDTDAPVDTDDRDPDPPRGARCGGCAIDAAASTPLGAVLFGIVILRAQRGGERRRAAGGA